MKYSWNLPQTQTTMKSEIIALNLYVQGDENIPAFFNDKDVRALLAGLSVVYEEVFIWTNREQVAVWVKGKDAAMVCQAFKRHYIKISNIYSGVYALKFFQSIMEGSEWTSTSSIEKLFQLDHARSLSNEAHALNSTLNNMVEEGIDSLTNRPVVFGLQNGWCYPSTEVKKERKTFIDFSSSFFRLSLN